MATLLHGTTRQRAEKIAADGPDPDFEEPGGIRAEGFSMYIEAGPFLLGTPATYACGKANSFPAEGGPAILSVEVPDEIVALAVDPICFPLSQGIVQFDIGHGLEELISAWPALRPRITLVEPC